MTATPTGVPAAPEIVSSRALSEFPTAIDLLRALGRRWGLVAVVGTVVGGFAALFTWLMFPAARYTSEAMLHVSSIPPRWIQLTNTHDSLIDFDTYKRTQMALLKSKLVLNTVLRDSEVSDLALIHRQKDPLIWLENDLQVRFDGEILRISLSDEQPEGLAKVVNAVVDAYLHEVVNNESRERAIHGDRLREIYEDLRERLAQKRKELDGLVDQAGATDSITMQYNQEAAALRRATAQREAQNLAYELRRLSAELEVLEGEEGLRAMSLDPPPERGDVARDVEALRQDEAYRALEQRLGLVEEEYLRTARLVRKRAGDPYIHNLLQERDQLRRKLAERADEIRMEIAQNRRSGERRDTRRNPTDELRRRIRVVELQKRQADADVQSLTGETKQLNRNSIELEMLRDELERIDTATERVGNMVESINVELNAPSRVRSIEVADTPRRQPDQRLQATGVVGVGVFGMIALVISVLEFRSRRVGSPEEVIKALPLPIIGTLPVVPSSGRLALPIADDQRWQHVLIESVDALRTLLIRARQVEGIRSVMITSALGGEGKTSLASHLAISLARAGLKTLLIDCDLRRPAMHRLFELPAGPGVTEVLGGGVPFEDAVQSVAPLSGLGVLTAGGSGYEAAHLLAQPAAHDLFAWARKTFDFVVVDTAPVLPVADTLLIGQHVDVAIFSILREVSRLPGLQAAQERLSRVGIRLLGAVVTGVRGDYFSGRYYE